MLMVREFILENPNEIIVLDFHGLRPKTEKFFDYELLMNFLLSIFDSPEGESYFIPQHFHTKTIEEIVTKTQKRLILSWTSD